MDWAITETWADTLDPELGQDLLTDVEREEQFREQLRQEGAEPAAERDDSGDFAL